MALIKAVTEEAERRARALTLTLVKEVTSSSKTIVAAAREAKKAFEEDRTDAGYAAIGYNATVTLGGGEHAPELPIALE